MKYVLIVGAKSDIAISLARIYALNGYHLYLAARESVSLTSFANDIKIRNNIDVQIKELDISNFGTHYHFFSSLSPKPIGVIIVSGFMSDQKVCQIDWEKTINTINVNYIGPVSLLNIFANYMEKNNNGFIVGVSSVAGDRGRKLNYIYGSSKAAFTTYLSGLRNRLFTSKINVLTVKPGFVATKMTMGLDLPLFLTAKPDQVAQDIYNAQQNGKDIVYTKSIWSMIMLFIKIIPEWKFKKMSL